MSTPTHLMLTVLCPLLIGVLPAAAEPITETQREFFENRIRPVLIEHCYDCHNSADTAEGGLAVDYRGGILAGGDGGEIVTPGQPEQSRLLAILRHEIGGLEMPAGGNQLDAATIEDFRRWITMGLPDPRQTPPSEEQMQQERSWEQTLQRRKEWWSFQPIRDVEPPPATAGNSHPVDRFIDAAIQEQDLVASPPADAAALVRRLFFTITGVPPSAEEATTWTERIGSAADRQAVIETLVDELLGRPEYGERFARHWMDWIRYAESHGSEGDPIIDQAWRYRDYLIRALNQDVPYDQLVREHVAGDLLDEPRINEALQVNESVLGTAHWRMVFHGFAPTDALEEKVRFIDDQINVFSKAFLGLTVSCARCHDHKFDAISQKDYYALFGILASCRPGRNVIDTKAVRRRNREALEELKPQIRSALADAWLSDVDAAVARLLQSDDAAAKASELAAALQPLTRRTQANDSFAQTWQTVRERMRGAVKRWEQFTQASRGPRWDLRQTADRQDWDFFGETGTKTAAGQFAIAPQGQRVLTGIYPSGVYSHRLSSKHPGRLTSPDFDLGEKAVLWVEAIGDGQAGLRYVVQDYPRRGTVYRVATLNDRWRWQRFDLSYWSGDRIHAELATAKDAPLLTRDQDRSWFGARRVVITGPEAPKPEPNVEALQPILAAAERTPPTTRAELRGVLAGVVREAIVAWQNGSLSDGQALLLDQLRRAGALEDSLASSDQVRELVTRYRELEAEIAVPRRAPGLDESTGRDQPLMVRGDHETLGEPVPRRFLEAIDATPYATAQSGRRELAQDLLRRENPLTRRVIVNRIWHHVFGRGLVATPDNFGQLGAKPSHPQLLDWLAQRFARDGWSLKRLVRLLVTSRTFQRSSIPQPGVAAADPENVYLAHANVRRLEAESIRDSLLAVSGQLERRRFGPPVNADQPRRSVYVNVIRNRLDPFLRAFDFPEPFSTVGRRPATNVPAQSLAMLNDPTVGTLAQRWAERLRRLAEPANAKERLRAMFLQAFGRQPTDDELARSRQFLDENEAVFTQQRQRRRELVDRRDELQQQIDTALQQARARLTSDAADVPRQASLPAAVASWDFAENARDQIGRAHLQLHEGARCGRQGLIVRNGGYAVTDPIDLALQEKTLEAWVRLDDLEQRGGGVMSLQTPDGRVFDAIVFGEKTPRRWLAGSEYFNRTESFGGTDEAVAEEGADKSFVQIVLTYHADGTIRAFRNGVAYGTEYASDGPQAFAADAAVISFGVRHLPAGGNRLLSGVIRRARLYDRALTPDQVASAARAGGWISDRDLLAALDPKTRGRVVELRRRHRELKTTLDAMPDLAEDPRQQAWVELARSLFLFKEFMYVR